MRAFATLGLFLVLMASASLGQISPPQLPPVQVIVRPCLIVSPQILLFTQEHRYHQLVLFNTCNAPLRWRASTPFPFIHVDTSHAVNPIPPGKMTPVGIYVDWNAVPQYAIAIRQPSPILDWLERTLGKSIPRQAVLYAGMGFVSFCEVNTPSNACVPVLILLLRIKK